MNIRLDRFPVPSVSRSCWRPAADVYRTATGWILKIELAGVQPQDVHVEVHGPRLTVSGYRRDLQLEIGWRCHSLEISYDRFERTFEFPCHVAECDPQMRFEHGMLWLSVQDCPET
jgi:HSP20 family protein